MHWLRSKLFFAFRPSRIESSAGLWADYPLAVGSPDL
jgi:hypothetical protein